MKRLSLLLTLACITTSTFAQTVNYGSSGLNQTSTTQPILFKNNGNEKVRIGSDGNVGIGTNAPTEKLEVIGNLKVSGTISSNSTSPAQIAILQTSRIKLMPGDTAIRIGDSTLYFIPSQNNIFGEGTTVKGTGIGRAAIGYGLRATALGYGNYVRGQYSTGIGAFAHTSTEANYAIAIGHGLSILQPLINTMQNTLWVGFNSTQPTLFVSSSAGGTTTGNVGIGTTNPTQKLEVNGYGRFGNSNGKIDFGNNGTNAFIESDKNLFINATSTKETTIGPGKLTASGSFQSNTNTYLATTSGNVGIGTTIPLKALDVVGDIVNGGSDFVLGLHDYRSKGSNKPGQRALVHYDNDQLVINFDGDFEGGVNVVGPFYVDGQPVSGTFWQNVSGTNKIYYPTGNVGIGNSNPGRTLDVSGSVGASSYWVGNHQLKEGQWDRTSNDITYMDGKVGIGTTSMPGNYKLYVNGTIIATETRTKLYGSWPDYVFESNYKLPSLTEVETYIKANKHLPGMPTAQEIQKDGIPLGEMNAKLLEKLEQITLYMIELKKENAELRAKMNNLESR